MRRFVRGLGDFVAEFPRHVVLAVVAMTIAMVGLSSMAEPLDNSQEAFSPDSPEFDAAIELRDRFSDSDTLALQVLVTTRQTLEDDGEPILSADGLAAALEVQRVLEAELGDVVASDQRRPGVLTFLTPVLRVAEQQGIDPRSLSDAQIVTIFEQASAQLPPEQVELFARLVAGDDPRTATTGLVVATLSAEAYADADDVEQARFEDQLGFQRALEATDLPEGIDALPFSFELLRGDDGTFMEEVQRLFGMAIVVVLLVLAGVLRARRGPVLGRAAAIRRTAADVALGLAVVVLANAWVAGLQVLLGPDFLGIVGPPTPPTNIVSILLIALGVDYAIHLQSRYRDEIAHDVEPEVAVRRASGTVGSAILLGALTTAVGFLTNLTSPLAPIRDLGVLAAVGLISAFVLTTTFLPAVRLLLDQRGRRRHGALVREEVAPTDAQLLPRLALSLGGPALRHPKGVIVAGIAVTLLGGVGITQLETEFDIAAFLPEGSDSQRAFVLINEDFGGGLGEFTSVLIEGDDVASAEVHNAQVAALDQLAGTDTVVTNAGAIVGQAPPLAVRQALALAASPDAPPPLVQAVETARAAGLQPDGTIDGDAQAVYAALGPTGLLAAVTDLQPDDPSQPPAVRWSLATQSQRTGTEAVVADFEDALAPVRASGVEAIATGDLIINLNAINALQRSQVRGLAVAFFAVLALLTLVYGRRLGFWDFGLLLMIPVAAVAICTLGLMALTGIPFDPITATVSALVIGVGIDFTIHLGERFVEDLDEADGDPIEALRASIRHTGSALAGSALTTALGFAVLTTGTVVPFQRLGSTTVYAVGLSLFAVVALQPAILLLWARRRQVRLPEHVYAHVRDLDRDVPSLGTPGS